MYRFVLLLALLALCLPDTLDAQLRQGDQLLRVGSSLQLFDGGTNVMDGGNLASVGYSGDYPGTVVSAGGNYGWLVTDRLAIGSAVNGLLTVHDIGTDASLSLSPYLRYYLYNQARLMVFGEASVGTVIGDDRSTVGDNVTLRLGGHYPLAAGVLLTPALTYQINQGRNIFSLGAGIELVLGPNNRPEARPTPTFKRGDVLLGGQFASLSALRNSVGVGAELGGYYFLHPRFAMGVAVQGSRFGGKWELGSRTQRIRSISYGLGVSSRYYLNARGRYRWFAEAGISFSHFDFRDDFAATEDNRTYLLGGAGMQWFVRENVALEVAPQLRYDRRIEVLSSTVNFGVRFLL